MYDGIKYIYTKRNGKNGAEVNNLIPKIQQDKYFKHKKKN